MYSFVSFRSRLFLSFLYIVLIIMNRNSSFSRVSFRRRFLKNINNNVFIVHFLKRVFKRYRLNLQLDFSLNRFHLRSRLL